MAVGPEGVEFAIHVDRPSSIGVIKGAALKGEGPIANYYPPDNKGKIPGQVLIALNASRTVTFSPYAVKLKGEVDKLPTEVTPEEFVENSPKIKYILDCIQSVKSYHKEKGTPLSGQLIYSDRGKEWFGHIREYLITKLGYQNKEIAIFDGTVSKSRREKIKEGFLRNDIKIIIGTSTMREGVDLQNHCSVIYVAYIDWNPTDMHQLWGRGWRFGNKHSHIRIVIPLIENSSDVFTWQKLGEKMSRLNSIWTRSAKTKMFEESELNAEELKKGLINDPEQAAIFEIKELKEGLLTTIDLAQAEIDLLKGVEQERGGYDSLSNQLTDLAKEAKNNPQLSSWGLKPGDKES